MHIPKLLCPAGSFESFKAAVNNGADAVYFGGRDFNARAGALNFTQQELREAIDYAHLRGVETFITINTLYKAGSPEESELFRAMAFAEEMYEAGADAFIVTDLGLFSLIRRAMPDMSLHASTQMTVHSLEGAALLGKLGFERVVLSRELSLDEIKLIAAKSGIEAEVFAHGALCVSYSGLCLMSSFLGGRSGNRGKCAQPCRQYYKLFEAGKKRAEGYLLSPRDIMTLRSIKEIAESGVHTLKIEGRMKSPEYVAVVTKAYREQLDLAACHIYDTADESVKDVTQIFNRGGESSGGYFNTYAGAHMMSIKTPKSTGTYLGKVVSVSKNTYNNGKRKILIKIEDSVVPGDGAEIWTEGENTGSYISEAAEAGAIVALYTDGPVKAGNVVYKSFDKDLSDRAKAMAAADVKKAALSLSLKAKRGEPLEIGLSRGAVTVTVKGPVVEASKNQPTTRERILEQVCKMGGTPFEINKAETETDIDENIYIPVSALNNLRRECVQKFGEEYAKSYYRKPAEHSLRFGTALSPAVLAHSEGEEAAGRYSFCIQAVSECQLEAACEEGIEKAYFTIEGYGAEIPLGIADKYADKTALYIALPKIMRPFDESACKELVRALEKTEIRGYLASTYGQLAILRELTKKEVITDYSFNVFNPLSYEYLKSLGAAGVTVSAELSLNELSAFPGGEAVVYGNLPLMITVNCPVGLYAAKEKNGKYCSLKNRAVSYRLVDKTAAAFPVYTDCEGCFAQILNGPKLNMQEKLSAFDETKLDRLRLVFYNEEYDEVKAILKGFRTGTGPGRNTGAAGAAQITYGHFFKGAK